MGGLAAARATRRRTRGRHSGDERDMSQRYERMEQAVRELYLRNRQQGTAPWCGYAYDFVCPSSGTYPFQWFWDSAFHAIVLSRFDVARAQAELASLLKNQQPDGFVAHVTFWQRERYEEMLSTYSIAYRTPYLSDCIQPPVIGESLEAIARRGGHASFLGEALPKLRRYFDWLDRVRDPDRDGLIATLQADESGLDHAPKYDAYLGVAPGETRHEAFTEAWERVAAAWSEVGREPARMFERDAFVVEDVLVNTIYALSQAALSRLLAGAGDAGGARELADRAARTRAGLVEKCYDPGAGLFFDLAGKHERMLRTNSVSSLLPLALPELPPEIAAALIRHLEDPEEYAARYPVPSVARNEPAYCPGVVGRSMVFRGPSWMNTNWYLTRGLRAHGRPELADAITASSAELVEREGFREYYDPETGQGNGARDFSWTALVLEMMGDAEATR